MSTDELDFERLFHQEDSLPRPNWDLIFPWLESQSDDEARYDRCTEISRRWLAALASDIDPQYHLDESNDFLIVGPQTRVANSALLRTAQQCRVRLLDLLPGVAGFSSPGKEVIIVFYGTELYYAHVSDYYPEGDFGGSSGMHIRGDWPHIVMLDADAPTIHQTLAHELTHAALSHLRLPQWIEEGLAQIAEHDVSGEGVSFDFRRVRKQKEHWRTLGLDTFWSGDAFLRPDESQEFGYQLAEILVRLLLEDFRPRWFGFDRKPLDSLMAFLTSAQRDDAGQAAAREHLGMTLGQLAARSLGPGNWEPPAPCTED
jgi:hypothetical protein